MRSVIDANAGMGGISLCSCSVMAPLAPSVAGSRDSYSVGAAALGAGEGLHAVLGAGSSLGLHTIIEGASVSLSRLAAGTLAGAGCSVGVILILNEGLTAGVISSGSTVIVGMTQSRLGLLSVGVAAVLTGVSGDLRLISSLVLGYLRSKVTSCAIGMSSVILAGAGVLGLSLSGRVVMLPLAPLVTQSSLTGHLGSGDLLTADGAVNHGVISLSSLAGCGLHILLNRSSGGVVLSSGDNHVILNADHIATVGAAGGHGLRTVLTAGGIHNVAVHSLRIMRRGGQLSSEGGVCGDGRCGGIGIPSIAVVAGSIGSLGGQSRYRSGSLALFHSLGAQRSVVLGHIVNGVRLGLRSRCLHGYFKITSRRRAIIHVEIFAYIVATLVVVITKGDSTISAVLVNKVQQIIADCCASCNFKTNSGNIGAINYYSSFRIHVFIY